MYYRYYGLQAYPFAVTPSGGSMYMGTAHREAFAALQWGLRDPNGYALIVGEPGTGKTSLVLELLETQHERIRIISFLGPRSFAEILDSIATALEIDRSNVGAAEFARLIKGRLNLLSTRLVLLFDEAQALGNSTLERLRLFTNDTENGSALMQIILVGQPELVGRMMQPALRALDQRIATRAELLPLGRSEVCEYIQHRLLECGGSVSELFSRAALRSLSHSGVRIPREINLVCGGALILAYGDGTSRVTASMIREAIRQYRGLQRSGTGLFGRCRKYVKATRPQTPIAPICAGAILISLFLLPRPIGSLHDEPVNSSIIKGARSPSKGRFEDIAPLISPPVITPHGESVTRVENRAPNPTLIDENKPKAIRSIVVEDGDTLSSLAEANLGSGEHEAVQRLLKANPLLTDPDLIYPGETIFLPSDSK